MIVAVINTKGGVGKTTTCMYLAEAARRAGRDVTVWDADPQGSSLTWSDQAAAEKKPVEFTVSGVHQRQLARAAQVEGDVIIDTPPGDPQVISNAVDAADIALVVTGPGGADVERAIETMDHFTGSTPALFLLTQYVKQETDSWTTWRSLRESDYPLLDTRIPRRAAIQRAYGSAINDELHGYERVLDEIVQVLDALNAEEGSDG